MEKQIKRQGGGELPATHFLVLKRYGMDPQVSGVLKVSLRKVDILQLWACQDHLVHQRTRHDVPRRSEQSCSRSAKPRRIVGNGLS